MVEHSLCHLNHYTEATSKNVEKKQTKKLLLILVIIAVIIFSFIWCHSNLVRIAYISMSTLLTVSTNN